MQKTSEICRILGVLCVMKNAQYWRKPMLIKLFKCFMKLSCTLLFIVFSCSGWELCLLVGRVSTWCLESVHTAAKWDMMILLNNICMKSSVLSVAQGKHDIRNLQVNKLVGRSMVLHDQLLLRIKFVVFNLEF